MLPIQGKVQYTETGPAKEAPYRVARAYAVITSCLSAHQSFNQSSIGHTCCC